MKRTREGTLEGSADTDGAEEDVGLVVGASIISIPKSSS